MSFKKILFLVFAAMFSYNLACAGQLLSKEAVNYYNEGVKAQKSGNLSAAASAYQKTILLDPSSQELRKYILNNTGAIYSAQGDLKKAEASFKEALELDPNSKRRC